jgi:glycosyltransferase involved in cell wall biosynthesis
MIYFNLADQGFKASSRASVGVYNVSVQLGAHLSDELPCTFLLNPEAQPGQLAGSMDTLIVKGGTGGWRRFAWDQWGLFSAVETEPSDWLFMPKGFSSFIRKPRCRLAVYIHDVVYSYWRRNYPGYRSPLLHKYFDWSLKASLRNASVIFTNSEFTAEEVRRFAESAGVDDLPPICCAGIGFDHLQQAPREENREGLLAYVSDWPHKGTPGLLRMLERWQRASGFAEPVYLLGTLPESVANATFPNWKYMSTLPETEYRTLLGRVRCSISNSEYEGFGMPPGEAVMQGAVPVYSSIPTHNEVMGDIGFSYGNLNDDEFTNALDEALKASRSRVEEWRSEFLGRHNWDKVVRNISEIIR